MKQPPPNFCCQFSPSLPQLLLSSGCTIVISTYQAGKLILISATDTGHLIQLPRTFSNAMAIGLAGNKMAVASADEVIVFANSPDLAKKYPKQPGVYDSFFVPRSTYYTGHICVHGLAWGTEGLWAVNTVFSCLSLIDDNFSFIPRWKPRFISTLAPEDRCHLNGMAMEHGKPLYITALGTGDARESWRATIPSGGVLIHVTSNEIILNNLSMPHSPRLYNGKLYMLLSATGEVITVDPEKEHYDVIQKINGFVRGLTVFNDHLFVGLSRLRKKSSTFGKLTFAANAVSSGIIVIHIPSGRIVGEARFISSVDEIFDIQILPGLRRPGILNTLDNTFRMALTTPETTYWGHMKGKNGRKHE
jgi:uncharacterized protein (TIGR03032 family)